MKDFRAAEQTPGYQRIVELVGAIGHFCTTGLMANVKPGSRQIRKPRPSLETNPAYELVGVRAFTGNL